MGGKIFHSQYLQQCSATPQVASTEQARTGAVGPASQLSMNGARMIMRNQDLPDAQLWLNSCLHSAREVDRTWTGCMQPYSTDDVLASDPCMACLQLEVWLEALQQVIAEATCIHRCISISTMHNVVALAPVITG